MNYRFYFVRKFITLVDNFTTYSRYCTEKYYPFDSKNLKKYVIGDDYLPTWEVPSLKKLYAELGYSMKDSFDAYVQKMGKAYINLNFITF